MNPYFVRTATQPVDPQAVQQNARKLGDYAPGGYNPMGELSFEEAQAEIGPQPGVDYPNPNSLPPNKVGAKQKKVKDMNPEELAAYRVQQAANKARAQEWMKTRVASPQNVLDHYNQATDDEKLHGSTWYQDAHVAAKAIARDAGISTTQAAALIANYSPQQHWAQNLRMASIAALGKKGIGGPGSGFMASGSQAVAADRILAGEDYNQVFGGGKPNSGQKIKAFASLIENGGDVDPNSPKVVMDRHALGVTHGDYADEAAYDLAGIGGTARKGVYEGYSNHFIDAANQLRAQGHDVNPHQLQAITWLTRQRLNAEGGYETVDTKTAERVKKVAESFTNQWNEYAAQHHPDLVGKVPGTGFSAAVMKGAPAQEPVLAFRTSRRRITTSRMRADDYRGK